MWERAFYHEGMSELQDRFDGRRVAEAIERHRKHYEFWDDEKALIESSPFFFIGTSFADYVDCNIKSGDPGFVTRSTNIRMACLAVPSFQEGNGSAARVPTPAVARNNKATPR